MEILDKHYYEEDEYAGFWLRLVAYMIDGFLISFIVLPIFFAIMGVSFLSSMEGFNTNGAMEPNPADIAGMILMAIGFSFMMLLGHWLYFALMESSSKQGTLGKLAVGIKVTDMNGDQLTFGRATGRHFSKIISGLTMNIGYIMAGFTDQKQALHDIIAKTLVIKKDALPLDD